MAERCRCGAVALYRVKARGFCRAHHAEAVCAATREMAARMALASAMTGHAGNYPGRQPSAGAVRLSTKGGCGRRGR